MKSSTSPGRPCDPSQWPNSALISTNVFQDGTEATCDTPGNFILVGTFDRCHKKTIFLTTVTGNDINCDTELTVGTGQESYHYVECLLIESNARRCRHECGPHNSMKIIYLSIQRHSAKEPVELCEITMTSN